MKQRREYKYKDEREREREDRGGETLDQSRACPNIMLWKQGLRENDGHVNGLYNLLS